MTVELGRVPGEIKDAAADASADSSAAAQPASHRRRDIQGLRAVAILMVVVFHATLPLPGGFTGVDVFFVISGFVIASMLLRDLEAGRRIRFTRFYERRARRLLPALALVTTATVIATAIIEPPFGVQGVTGLMGRATSLFIANIVAYRLPSGYFGTNSVTDPLLHMWSLGVEEQFYLFFPMLLLLSWQLGIRLRRRVNKVVGVLLFIGIAGSFAYCCRATRQNQPFAFYWIQCRAWEFGIGTGLALAIPYLRRFSSVLLGNILWIAGLALLAVAGFALSSSSVFPGPDALVPVAGSALILAAGAMTQKGLPRLLGVGLLVVVGDVSYSWYLWHWPAIVLMRAAIPDSSWPPIVAAFASFIPAWLSLKLIENPIRYGSISRRQLLVLITACIAIPLIFSQGLLTLAGKGWDNQRLRIEARSAMRNSLAERTGCQLHGTVTEGEVRAITAPTGKCRFNVRHPHGVIALVGDSHGGALSGGVVRAGNQLGYDVQVTTGSSCPFTPWAAVQNQFVGDCGTLYRLLLHQITTDRAIRLVVISHANYTEARSLRDHGVRQPIEAWALGVAQTLRALHAARIPVLLVDDVPVLSDQPTQCRFGVLFALDCSASRSFVEKAQGLAEAAVVAAAHSVPGVHVLSLTNAFCTRSECNALQHGQVMYFDSAHLSDAGSLYVSADLQRAIALSLK